MQYLNNKAVYLFMLIGALMLSAGAYYIKLIFSDSRYIEENSIEYIILVPAILKEIPLEESNQVKNYYYSSADGNKPVINAVEFTTLKTSDEIVKKLMNYFNGLGFENYNDSYKKDNMEISITHSKGDGDVILVNVTLLEYL